MLKGVKKINSCSFGTGLVSGIYPNSPPGSLFYKMSPGEVCEGLNKGIWEEEWTRMASTDGNHSIRVEDCRNAVTRLCHSNGVEYAWGHRGHDKEIVKEDCEGRNVEEMLIRMRCS